MELFVCLVGWLIGATNSGYL